MRFKDFGRPGISIFSLSSPAIAGPMGATINWMPVDNTEYYERFFGWESCAQYAFCMILSRPTFLLHSVHRSLIFKTYIP